MTQRSISSNPLAETVAYVLSVLAPLEAPRLAISGGSAATLVGALRAALGAQWKNVRLTWADERCVPFAHADSNRGAAYRDGLDEADPPATELALYLDGETPFLARRRVEREFESLFDGGLDVAILGMGTDGHIASLFPGRANPMDAFASAILDSPKPPAARITLTHRALNGHNVVYALGSAKAEALRRTFEGDPSMPAASLPHLLLVSDFEF